MVETRNLPIEGLTVTHVTVNDSLCLFCRAGDGREAEIRIDGAFLWHDHAGNKHGGCVEDKPSSAGPVLDAIYTPIATARINEDGTLEIAFGDGAILIAAAEDHFVSWEIKGTGGFHAVCLADGGVVVKDIA